MLLLPVASLIMPDNATIKPYRSTKEIRYVNRNWVSDTSACDKGSILTEIVDLRSPNFKRWNNVPFINL